MAGTVCYDVATGRRETVHVGGEPPKPVNGAAIIVKKDTVFSFGGADNQGKCSNDLYLLDMVSMRWRIVQVPITYDAKFRPRARCGHTLTRISESAAILFGGWGPDIGPFGDSWILNLNNARDLENESPIWTKFTTHNYSPMMNHRAVLDPAGQRLWLIGGIHRYGENVSAKLQKVSLNVLPLKVHAAEVAAKHFKKGDSSLEAHELPNELKREVEANRYIMADESQDCKL